MISCGQSMRDISTAFPSFCSGKESGSHNTSFTDDTSRSGRKTENLTSAAYTLSLACLGAQHLFIAELDCWPDHMDLNWSFSGSFSGHLLIGVWRLGPR